MTVDFARWDLLIEDPNWYKTIIPELNELQKDPRPDEVLKEEILTYFDTHLASGQIGLGKIGKNFDAERLPVDTMVIHHTAGVPGMSLTRLSTIELLRLYAPYYLKPYGAEDAFIAGQAIYSGHFRNGKQVFWPYHWMIRHDGNYERLLMDNEIGWQAGTWGVNRRSVAIVFDNNYENSCPSRGELRAAAEIISKYYPTIASDHILGHREVNPKTTCPSNFFLDTPDRKGWKHDLISYLA